jgi:exodeoxyribonuclease VII large subunit
MWRKQAQAQDQPPVDGAQVTCHGEVRTYTARSQYQLVVDHLQPVGLGNLFAELERRKRRLAAEGLLDSDKKRPLPAYPRRIGVVTSKEGAVLADIRTTLARRWPLVEVVVVHAQVQGAMAAPDLAEAIRRAGGASVDVILLARGGGSLEDLRAFNEEAVVRAVRAVPVPVVCGVGHETDTTLADLAADVRAATPTAAAELTVPDRHQVRQLVDGRRIRADALIARRLTVLEESVAGLKHRNAIAAPGARLVRARRALVESDARLHTAAARALASRRALADAARRRLEDLSPGATLARGYAHVRRLQDGLTIVSPDQAAPGTALSIRVARGQFQAQAVGAHREEGSS